MRRRLLSEGAKELSYEIREIVKKANQLKALGLPIHWENIGDPIEKKCQRPCRCAYLRRTDTPSSRVRCR